MKQTLRAFLPAILITTVFSTAACAQNSNSLAPFAVVELFTSEGCSSCPPADQLLVKITENAHKKNMRIFALGFHVDYWDYLGWVDPFSQEAYSQRQRLYAKIQRANSVYTPQMIINGEHSFGGYREDLANEHINNVLKGPAKTNITLSAQQKGNTLHLQFSLLGKMNGNHINVALVENKRTNFVPRGENAGKNLVHANAVRIFRSYPIKQTSGELTLDIPEDLPKDQSTVIVYIQNPKTMQILGANQIALNQ